MRQIVGRLVHADELRCEVEEKGGFELTAPLLLGVAFDKVGDIDRHEVDDFGRCVLGKGREECLDVGSWRWAVMITTSSMPWSSQLARSSFMARWKVFRRSVPVPEVRRPVRLRKAVMERQSHHHLQATGKVEGDALGDECISAERQVWSVVVERATWEDQARITGEQATDFGPGKSAQPQ